MADKFRAVITLSLLGIILSVTFILTPIPVGDDWEVYYQAGRRVLTGDPLYGEPVYLGFYYYNAPWLAIMITPFTLLPPRWGWGILSALTLILTTRVVSKWEKRLVKPVV